MNALTIRLYFLLGDLVERKEGQDLVEYSLVLALISFGAIAGMQLLATNLNNVFDTVADVFTSNIS